MKKTPRSEHERLSTAVNPRFDVVGPKKELENAEKQIEKVRKEAQKSFEREKKQLVKKLESLPTTRLQTMDLSGRKISRSSRSPSSTDDPSMSSHKVSLSMDSARIRKISGYLGSDLGAQWSQQGTSSRTSLSPDTLLGDDAGTMSAADKQMDALRQLKFLYDCAVQLVIGAEAAHKMSTAAIKPGQGSTPKQTTETEDGADAIDPIHSRHISREAKEVTFTKNENQVVTGSKVKGPVMESSQSSPFGNILPDFQGPPSQAVQLISMARVLTLGHAMEAKEMKALTGVIEESRVAVKSVKSGMDPDRAQEKLVKKLNELLDLVKPRGSDLIISPEELLRCSYLRLSKENITRLEDMIREKGEDPGIHYHSDVGNYLETVDLSASPSGALSVAGSSETDLVKNFQPVSIYMTKPGAPIDKRRISKPESMSTPSTDEDAVRMKKFRAV